MHSLHCALLAALVCASATAAEGKLVLVKDGKPQATIVIAAEPSKNAKAAADELQLYIEKISGAKLPIATDAATPAGALVLVGPSTLTDAIKGLNIPTGATNDMREEGFVILCKGDRLVLAGNDT